MLKNETIEVTIRVNNPYAPHFISIEANPFKTTINEQSKIYKELDDLEDAIEYAKIKAKRDIEVTLDIDIFLDNGKNIQNWHEEQCRIFPDTNGLMVHSAADNAKKYKEPIYLMKGTLHQIFAKYNVYAEAKR